ncbi:hypothetical protein EQM14_12685 [Caproiciproducens sp. NJN-50]|uniref:hypothetical protein n=1 Tax=Acutalibacteraceae TaxID=3082771 RepID=UPI000FFE18DA|nr:MULTISPECIES: hypothetical protein [Acutalibacteraceae]QAT50552.1 hypothetical protein EQM14_12685 [Caproiciproducens sp. NJN-50]
MECLNCGRPAEYVFHVLEVRTLHIRDIFGEKRVQALGKSLDYAVCRTCAAARLEQIRRPGKRMVKSGAPFAAALALGIVLISLLPTGGNAVLRLMGPAAAICGILGLAATVRDGFRRRKEFGALQGEEAMARAAWECLLEAAPRKAGDSDLTYIPVDRKTLALKNGDLMILYHLLPQIAAQAYDLIHCG